MCQVADTQVSENRNMSADGNEVERKAVSAAGKGKRKAVYRNDRISPGRSTHLRDAAHAPHLAGIRV